MNVHSVYQYHQPKRKKHHTWPWVAAIIFICVAFLGFMKFSAGSEAPSNDTPKSDQQTTIDPEKNEPIAATSKVLFAGDVFWSRRMNTWAQASPLKEAYPFSGLSGFNRPDYDAWVGNMECPADPTVEPTTYQEEELLMFNCPASYLPELAKWFNIVSLANNHTDNHGLDSFQATRQELDKNNIQYFGHYDPSVTNEVCEVISLPAQTTLTDKSTGNGYLPIALCGYHGVFKIPSSDSIAVMKEYSQYMPVIAMPHMGTEYKPSADGLRTNIYRQMLDNGADAVLGGHPHWVQNSEAYKGKLIVYSLGNFIFDQQSNAEVTRSAAITVELKTPADIDKSQLATWLKIGEGCKKFADDCLEQIKQKNLNELPVTLTYGMTAGDSSNKLTKPASPDIAQSVAERLNWNNTASDLIPAGIPFSR